ncbi:hypothetical protein GYB57_05865 [bacterium]|nr:hypothetical protein [bacterium]
MSTKYKVNDNSKPYYITTTIVGWVDVFTREVQKERLVEFLKYCQESKGLIIYAWCLMTKSAPPDVLKSRMCSAVVCNPAAKQEQPLHTGFLGDRMVSFIIGIDN